jgi:predicted RND superfamily exporter protein
MHDKDVLEDFIRKNREDFDVEKAPTETWRQIERSLGMSAGFGKWLPHVIVVVSLIVLTLFVIEYLSKSSDSQDSPVPLEYASLNEYIEIEDHYKRQSAELYQLVFSQVDDATLMRDLSLLDEVESELKKELAGAEGVYKEQVIQAMIRNLQVKHQLLNDVLIELKIENNENTAPFEKI